MSNNNTKRIIQPSVERRYVSSPELADDRLLTKNERDKLIATIRQSLYERYKNHGHETGSQYKNNSENEDYTHQLPKKEVHCFSYVQQSMADGYRAIDKPEAAKKILSFDKGTDLSRYLKGRGWRAVYYNSDTNDPGKNEQNSTTLKHVRQTGSYYPNRPEWTVPVDDQWLDYGIHSQNYSEEINKRINKEDFGFVNANNGGHTALLMNGALYEVHWLRDGEEDYPPGTPESHKLYEKTDFNKWKQHKNEEQKQGVVMLPPLPKES